MRRLCAGASPGWKGLRGVWGVTPVPFEGCPRWVRALAGRTINP
jgi:hypothetical protein